MMPKIFYSFFAGLCLLVSPLAAQNGNEASKVEQEFDLGIGLEYRYFFDEAQFTGQKDHFPALSITPEYKLSWQDGYQNIYATGFFRLDIDRERTHADIREFYYQKASSKWELNLGVKKIFWGVTESNHLVDIINQTDQVESFDGEQKLGQPLAQFTWSTNKAGTFDFFYLPVHRKRNFPGEKGRFRFATLIDQESVGYENDNLKAWHPGFAFRWSHYIGIIDLAISDFYGPGREPLFAFLPSGEVEAFYPIINQVGLELQVTHNAFLWKLESIYRTSELQDMFALAAGLEYTFSNVDGNGLDIGVLGEYLYDDRDALSLNGLQNDLFIGSRLAFNDVNDTSILAGGIVDLTQSSHILSIEGSRRLGNSFTLSIEGRVFSDIANEDFILNNFAADSFGRLNLIWRL